MSTNHAEVLRQVHYGMGTSSSPLTDFGFTAIIKNLVHKKLVHQTLLKNGLIFFSRSPDYGVLQHQQKTLKRLRQ